MLNCREQIVNVQRHNYSKSHPSDDHFGNGIPSCLAPPASEREHTCHLALSLIILNAKHFSCTRCLSAAVTQHRCLKIYASPHVTAQCTIASTSKAQMCVCVGGENGFPKRPGMVDEFDQQVSTSMDGKHIPLIELAMHA